MRASVFYDTHDIRCEDVPEPRIGPGELLISVKACGLCGTDVSKALNKKVPPGSVLGHEVAGQVIEVGEGVNGFEPGQRVFVAHHVPCFTCQLCLHDHHTRCHQFTSQVNIDPGGFAERMRVLRPSVEKATLPIPDCMSYEEACFIEPLACVLRGQRKCKIQPGDSVVVIGLGPIGLLHVQLARFMGATRVIGIDIKSERLEMAKQLGATCAFNAAKEEAVKAMREASDGIGADLVINTVGIAAVYEGAINYLRDGGTLCFFAECPPHSQMVFDPELIARREVSLIGSYSSTPLELPVAFKLINDRIIKVEPLISHRLGLDEVSKAIELASSGNSLKVIIIP